MKKIENIPFPHKSQIIETKQLEENQKLPTITTSEEFGLSWVSKNTYFTLSPTRLEKIKETFEKAFKSISTFVADRVFRGVVTRVSPNKVVSICKKADQRRKKVWKSRKSKLA